MSSHGPATGIHKEADQEARLAGRQAALCRLDHWLGILRHPENKLIINEYWFYGKLTWTAEVAVGQDSASCSKENTRCCPSSHLLLERGLLLRQISGFEFRMQMQLLCR